MSSYTKYSATWPKRNKEEEQTAVSVSEFLPTLDFSVTAMVVVWCFVYRIGGKGNYTLVLDYPKVVNAG